jgi:DNA-binding MarR family transcriptional regulator
MQDFFKCVNDLSGAKKMPQNETLRLNYVLVASPRVDLTYLNLRPGNCVNDMTILTHSSDDATPDLESRAGPNDHDDLRLWLRLLTCCNLIEGDIRSRLRTDFETTLPRFDLMAQLLRVPEGMKMSELSRHMMVTNGNITGITDQLEKEGLVERIKVASDRRSSIIRLTPKGKRSFKRMADAHEQWIRGLFGSLSEHSRQALFEALGELKLLAQTRLQSNEK